jgi:Zn-dependent protease
LISSGLAAALATLMTIGMLALSVTLHELGHIGAARVFGIGTTGITLYPFGGIARLTREARTSTEEVVVALAGPAVNVLLAGLAVIPLLLLGPVTPVLTFLGVNVALALFNLVPAYPMDGGRVFRGVLWNWMGRVKATRYAARAGQGFAVLFGILGLFSNTMLVIIAIFIYMQASAELKRLEWERQYGPAPAPGVARPVVLGPDGRPVARQGWGQAPGRSPSSPTQQVIVTRDANGRQVVLTVMDPWEMLNRYRGVG